MQSKISTLIFSLVAILFVSCDFNMPSVNDFDPNAGTEKKGSSSALAGLWGSEYDKQRPDTTKFNWFYRFDKDSTFECYFADTYSSYRKGTYTRKESVIVLKSNHERHFTTVENRSRLYAIYDATHNPQDLYTDTLEIRSLSKDSLVLYSAARKEGYCFYPVSTLGKKWNKEYSEPAVTATQGSLTAQWDILDYYILSDSQWWYFYDPVYSGMLLKPNSKIGDGTFIQDRLEEKLRETGVLTNEEYVSVAAADCSWSFSQTLTLTCTKCTTYMVDASGNVYNQTTMSPKNPYKMEYSVFLMTDHYLVLFSKEQSRYYVFYLHSQSSSAPSLVAPGKTQVMQIRH